jgi:hypothetical protein
MLDYWDVESKNHNLEDDWEPEIEWKIIWIHRRNLKSKIKKIGWELDYYRRELTSVRLIKIIEEKWDDWQITKREEKVRLRDNWTNVIAERKRKIKNDIIPSQEGIDIKLDNNNWISEPSTTQWNKEKKEWKTKNLKEKTIWLFSNLEEGINYYESIWYSVVSKDVKRRTAYILDLTSKWKWKVKLEIDEYFDLFWIKDIPPLLEIEAMSEEVVMEVAWILWFEESDVKDWWTRKLYEYYKNKILKNHYTYLFLLILIYNDLWDREQYILWKLIDIIKNK